MSNCNCQDCCDNIVVVREPTTTIAITGGGPAGPQGTTGAQGIQGFEGPQGISLKAMTLQMLQVNLEM